MCLMYRRNTGKRPNTWMLKSINENTWVVLGRVDANTTAAVMAALVEKDAGNLMVLVSDIR